VFYRHTSESGWNANINGHNHLIISRYNKVFTETAVLRGTKFYQVVTEDSEKKSASIFKAANKELFSYCPEEQGCATPRPN
jgi:hypothetical protein